MCVMVDFFATSTHIMNEPEKMKMKQIKSSARTKRHLNWNDLLIGLLCCLLLLLFVCKLVSIMCVYWIPYSNSYSIYILFDCKFQDYPSFDLLVIFVHLLNIVHISLFLSFYRHIIAVWIAHNNKYVNFI